MKKIAIMFPGQGSQKVGMGREFHHEYPSIQKLYNLANDTLNFDLTKLMFEGPEETLTETENAQAALLLSSIAAYSLLEDEKVEASVLLGHSLGEYSALVAAGVLQLEDALPLVANRGRLMEKAFPSGLGSMSAVLGLTKEEIEENLSKVQDQYIVDIANLNCPGQIVISGEVEGLAVAEKLLLDAGARRVIRLNVSGPFHSRLMKKANESFESYVSEVPFSEAEIPVYANVSAEAVTNQNEIKQLLLKQLYSPVRFEESIVNIASREEVDAFVEVGQGRVLSGLVRKINRKVKTFSIQDPSSLEKFLKWYRED